MRRGRWRWGQRQQLRSIQRQMFFSPREQRQIVNGKRLATVKMPARTLFGRAAGMEYRLALFRRQARQVQVLERVGGNSRNVRPPPHALRRAPLRFAKSAISCVVPELEFEKFEREILEIRPRRLGTNEFAQAVFK